MAGIQGGTWTRSTESTKNVFQLFFYDMKPLFVPLNIMLSPVRTILWSYAFYSGRTLFPKQYLLQVKDTPEDKIFTIRTHKLTALSTYIYSVKIKFKSRINLNFSVYIFSYVTY